MESTTAAHCRNVLDRLRAQIDAHLPAVTSHRGSITSESIVPLDRLPMLGQVVQQYVEAEAVYASANQLGDRDGNPTNDTDRSK